MFILSGLFLEDGENLFRDFWSPFSIFFLTFSARPNYLKKKSTALRAVSNPDTSARPAFKAAARAPPQPKSPPPRNPSRRRPCRRPRRPAARPATRDPPEPRRRPPPPTGAVRCRRRHANRGSRRFFSKNHSVLFRNRDSLFYIRSVYFFSGLVK